eukprot:scaffold451_cov365-Prasinococcus_capsulatus_cf.AAC.22
MGAPAHRGSASEGGRHVKGAHRFWEAPWTTTPLPRAPAPGRAQRSPRDYETRRGNRTDAADKVDANSHRDCMQMRRSHGVHAGERYCHERLAHLLSPAAHHHRGERARPSRHNNEELNARSAALNAPWCVTCHAPRLCAAPPPTPLNSITCPNRAPHSALTLYSCPSGAPSAGWGPWMCGWHGRGGLEWIGLDSLGADWITALDWNGREAND